MKISIIGTGYVGLVSGVCLAARGHQVTCIDKRTEIIDQINRQETPIFEPGLEELLKEVIAKGTFIASTDLRSAVMNTDISLIAVGTPFGNGKIDLTYIENSAREIGEILKEKAQYHVVCVKSTVVPTTTDTLVRQVLEASSGKRAGEFGLAMNPEFLREGKAVEDFMYPDRIVLGAYDQQSFEVMKKVYDGIFDAPIIKVNLRTAEMIKYTANALLATLISYSNEIALICENVGSVDVKDVLEGVTLDKRFNPVIGNQLINPEMISYLRAGCGFGGSCFPKDVKALASFSEDLGYAPRMIQTTLDINETQPVRIVERLEATLGTLANKKIALLGLAFKPDTDDIRESPSLIIIRELLNRQAQVYAVDPIAIENTKKVVGENGMLLYADDYQQALQDADAVILVTSWADFAKIAPDEFVKLMKTPVVADGRRIFDKNVLEAAGVQYLGVGLA
ncbi:UDP-glucose dehydrogenase family protein [Heliophilum fasciatum]|uniref:UDP-glucose 6-dehydrogenase n=1 Tax=Heliophilum fasciatum TaxID=35700 RepID=A0A4R2RL86_9FIRM|nr:UDP-glucose/GDP-mannose dehydrogenase family protein [Heliophilum fasciatum]MCW2279261.1 UDPglucose 6-dehydrogenase/GDP-mannose 6-dehydrogenase [Heliophilum fasciatum]TCP60491.1 UDPglucose 6-dehydrogenase/GDP-mannose 6-dehydrogenase [Heliophilum fasciatum]